MIKQMETKEMVDGLVTNGSGEDPPFCVGYAYGKSHWMYFPYGRLQKLVISFIMIFLDPSTHPLLVKQINYTLFKDDHSSFSVIYYIKEKPTILECLQRFLG